MRHALIPAPVSITETGDDLVLPAATFQRYTGPALDGDGLHIGAPDRDDEGYRLRVDSGGVVLEAGTEAGAVRGIQTLIQLARPEGDRVHIPGLVVEDAPRYPWRGLMLDIARHFFGEDDIRRVIDLAVLYKLNVLHLHLSDDQGWRLEIPGRPELTEVGGRTQVGEGNGGFLTMDEYRRIVDYAAARHITIVPEIDLPGHTNAALLAYPDLAPAGVDVRPYRGVDVGFSTLDVHNDDSYALVEDVIAALAAVHPGGYMHIGGDEALSTTGEDYRTFVNRALAIADRHGMMPVAWQESVTADIGPGTIVQYWDTRASEHLKAAVRRGAGLVMSPADRVYLDMRYEAGFPLGQDWAGTIDVRDAFDWDPVELTANLDDNSADAAVRGIEAALWTETIVTRADIDTMLLPRLPAVAERAWSPAGARDWEGFRTRLTMHAELWSRLGYSYRRSPQVFSPPLPR